MSDEPTTPTDQPLPACGDCVFWECLGANDESGGLCWTDPPVNKRRDTVRTWTGRTDRDDRACRHFRPTAKALLERRVWPEARYPADVAQLIHDALQKSLLIEKRMDAMAEKMSEIIAGLVGK